MKKMCANAVTKMIAVAANGMRFFAIFVLKKIVVRFNLKYSNLK